MLFIVDCIISLSLLFSIACHPFTDTPYPVFYQNFQKLKACRKADRDHASKSYGCRDLKFGFAFFSVHIKADIYIFPFYLKSIFKKRYYRTDKAVYGVISNNRVIRIRSGYNCVQVYIPEIHPVFKSAERAQRNPYKLQPVIERKAEIDRLEKEMRKAAQMLEYEYAAVLRDQIIRLRGEK